MFDYVDKKHLICNLFGKRLKKNTERCQEFVK